MKETVRWLTGQESKIFTKIFPVQSSQKNPGIFPVFERDHLTENNKNLNYLIVTHRHVKTGHMYTLIFQIVLHEVHDGFSLSGYDVATVATCANPEATLQASL